MGLHDVCMCDVCVCINNVYICGILSQCIGWFDPYTRLWNWPANSHDQTHTQTQTQFNLMSAQTQTSDSDSDLFIVLSKLVIKQ